LNTKLKINNQIKSEFVLLISDTEKNLGKKNKREAIKLAQEKDLDLVQVNNKGKFPVCKIMDYGKYKYKKTKNEHKNHHKNVLKEIIISLNIDEHDLKTKHNKVSKFLAKNFQVKYSLHLPSGRQPHDKEYVKEYFCEKVSRFKDVAIWDKPTYSDRKISTILMPAHNEKSI